MGASLSELEQPPETHQNSQSQPQQHQHQPNEPTNYKELRLPSRTENLLLSPQHHTQPSTNSTKSVPNAKVVLKTNESTQSAAKPLVNQLSLPHNYEYILKDADSTIDKSSREKLCDQLYAGVFLDHKTKASSIYIILFQNERVFEFKYINKNGTFREYYVICIC